MCPSPPGQTPLLSVLTPAKNVAAYIARCVDSVLALDRADVEHIIVDGGSSDETVDVVGAFAAKHPGRIRFARVPDRSMTEGLINAVRMSRGRYLGPLNADDRYLPGVHRALEVLAVDSPEVLIGDCRVVREDGSLRHVTHPWLADHLSVWHLLGCLSPECAYFISRASYEAVGGYRDEFRYIQDYDLLLRLARSQSFTHVGVEVGEFVWSRTSVSGRHRDDMLREFGKINALRGMGARLQLLRVHKLGRILMGIERHRLPGTGARRNAG